MFMSFNFGYGPLNTAVFISNGVLHIDDVYKYYKDF